MKARLNPVLLLSLITFSMYGGDLDGLWRSADQSRNIEVLYTTNGIKVKSADRFGNNDWINYDRYDNNRYRDARGNCLSLFGNTLEWCTADRRQVINYSRNTNNGSYDRGRYGNETYGSGRARDRDSDRDRDWNHRDDWSRKDRDGWNNYYKSYEGKWHNHSTGTHIHVDLTRRSLRIKFHGDRWYEVMERNRGLFVDNKGNEFIFRGDGIEYRANDGDLVMKFYSDDRCDHHDDYRSEYWR